MATSSFGFGAGVNGRFGLRVSVLRQKPMYL